MMRPAINHLLVLALVCCGMAGSAQVAHGSIAEDSGNISSQITGITPNNFSSRLNFSYEEIDRHALSAPASARATVESLAAYLIEPAKNDREKARAIFRWIAANIDYNVQVFFRGGSGPTAAADVLKSGKSVCYGYSDLYLALAKEAGLEAAMVSGYGKGYGYQPGDNFSGPSNHAWNAVLINGSWYLIDSTWGAGYVSGEGRYVRHFDDHYFMTPPTQFIYDHLPEEERWQLLDCPISEEQFEGLPNLESDFFSLGLSAAGLPQGVVEAARRANISIQAPEGVLMTAGLEYAGAAAGRPDLDRRTFCQRRDGKYEILAEFPEAGRYILKAYARKRSDPGEYNSVMELGVNATTADEGGLGFPLAYSAFTEAGAYLYSPMQGRLTVGESYWFRIFVPGAQDVAVVSGEQWTHLSSRGGVFEGNATVAEGETGVYAKIGGTEWDGMAGYLSE